MTVFNNDSNPITVQYSHLSLKNKMLGLFDGWLEVLFEYL